MAVEDNKPYELEPYNFAEWPSDDLQATAIKFGREIEAKEMPAEALQTLDYTLGHMAFEIWYRKQRGDEL